MTLLSSWRKVSGSMTLLGLLMRKETLMLMRMSKEWASAQVTMLFSLWRDTAVLICLLELLCGEDQRRR